MRPNASPRSPRAAAASGAYQLLDLAGDGQLDLVTFDRPDAGLFRAHRRRGLGAVPQLCRGADRRPGAIRTCGSSISTATATPTCSSPSRSASPGIRSLGEEGFGPARRVPQALDEEHGPRLVFADGTQSDLSRRHVRRRPGRYRAGSATARSATGPTGLRPLRRQGHDGRRAVVRRTRISSTTRASGSPTSTAPAYRHHLSRPRRRPPLLQPVRQRLERARTPAAVPARRQPHLASTRPICSATAPPAWCGRRRCPATRAGRCATST